MVSSRSPHGPFYLLPTFLKKMLHIKGALGYAIQLSANSNDVGGGATMLECNLDPPEFDSNSDPDLDSHSQCVQLGYSIITRMITSIPTMTTSTSFSTQTNSGSNTGFLRSSSSQRGPSYYTGSLFSQRMTTSPLTNGEVDESSKMHSQALSRYSIVPTTWMIIGPRPAFYLAQANLDPVLLEGFMADGFAAGGQRTATVNVENFHGFPTRILGHELTDKFCERPLRFGTRIVTARPSLKLIYLSEDEESDTADTVIVATSASAKRLGLKGEEVYWHSGFRACVVRVGAVPIFRKYGSHIYVFIHRNKLCASKIRLMNNPKTIILWNTVAAECQGNSKELKNLRLFYAPGHEPAMAIFRTQLQTDPEGIRGIDKAITSAGSEAERLIAEEEEEMMGEQRERGKGELMVREKKMNVGLGMRT
ncbi:hypothetical protein K435DRAFT_793767 [Dendrothele bispora CBS 962.96]|uniref:FAD/NAD(P)-binding domain-containing protein n=1 Tax=Dendrothele bispora (strain CBS 962.96) TaxID=1314807 RepID=A0A4S8MEB1_DENBC|nr:hypothetical protein K435DRAFT_793767 [Dendrothele bispora CBS 962.96]